MGPDRTDSLLEIVVCHAVTDQIIWYKSCLLPQGASVRDAIVASGFEQAHPQVNWAAAGIGIYGQRCSAQTRLQNHDRVEIYRPLVFEPKESRRRRAKHRQKRLSTKGDSSDG